MIDLPEGRRLLNTSIIEWDNWVLMNAEAMLTLLEQAREVLEPFTHSSVPVEAFPKLREMYYALTATDAEVKHD